MIQQLISIMATENSQNKYDYELLIWTPYFKPIFVLRLKRIRRKSAGCLEWESRKGESSKYTTATRIEWEDTGMRSNTKLN